MTATVAGIHLGIDTHANRPAANSVPDGSLYSCSDHDLIYKSNFAGNSWATWVTAGGSVGGGGELDYVQFTSPVSVTATSEAAANTVVTGSAVVYDGSTIVVVEFFAPWARPQATAAHDLSFWLYDGSSSIGRMGLIRSVAAQNQWMPVRIARRLTPSAASHTYSIRASLGAAGTGSIQAGAGGSGAEMPGFIRIFSV